jgi:hypothetical protein
MQKRPFLGSSGFPSRLRFLFVNQSDYDYGPLRVGVGIFDSRILPKETRRAYSR